MCSPHHSRPPTPPVVMMTSYRLKKPSSFSLLVNLRNSVATLVGFCWATGSSGRTAGPRRRFKRVCASACTESQRLRCGDKQINSVNQRDSMTNDSQRRPNHSNSKNKIMLEIITHHARTISLNHRYRMQRVKSIRGIFAVEQSQNMTAARV